MSGLESDAALPVPAVKDAAALEKNDVADSREISEDDGKDELHRVPTNKSLPLQYSKAKTIALVVNLTGAAFINVSQQSLNK